MTVSSQIIEVIDALCARFGIAIDWTAENVMPMLQEMAGKFITWEIATSWAWIGIMAVVTAIMVLLSITVYVLEKKTNYIDLAWLVIGCTVCVALACVLVCGAQTMDIIEATTFPEKSIFEYIKGVLNNN